MRLSRKILVPAAVVLLLLGLVIGNCVRPGVAPTASPTVPRSAAQELEVVEEAWNLILRDFVGQESLDPQVLKQAAIEGMIEALNDPYTSYIRPDHYDLTFTHLMGKFDGIGATVGIRDDRVTIISPIPGTPADEAGIKAGDQVLQIDGDSTEGMSVLQAVTRIRGPRGTPVTLTVLHKGAETPVQITIIRDEIKVSSVEWEMLPGDIAHVRLLYFTEESDRELIEALQQARAEGMRGMVFDLRNNTGGPLDTAVTVASQFLTEGLVVYVVDNEGQRQDWPVERGGAATDLPLAVLVNEGAASAAEVVAGALRDHQRGPLIGVKTFGKGSVNLLHRLSDGSGLYITTGRWYTPNGQLIEGEGIAPDPGFEVEITDEDVQAGRDPQLERALEYLKGRL